MPIFATNCHISIGSYIEEQNVYASKKTEIEEAKEVIEEVVSNIPAELNTEQARKYWTICQEKGWIDENLQPKNITQEQAAIIADAIGAKLNLLHRWSDFEELWKIKNLRGKFDRGYNHNESLQSFAYDVEIAISRA